MNLYCVCMYIYTHTHIYKESAYNVGKLRSITGLGRSPGEGNGYYPLQYSGLENSMNCIVHGVAKSRTRLSDFNFHFLIYIYIYIYIYIKQ